MAPFFGSTKKHVRYGIVVELGSGSVTISVVESDSREEQPTILWRTRKYASHNDQTKQTEAGKPILTALFDAFMQFDGDGRRALQEARGNRAKLTHMQVSIAAPFSYTVTKTVTHQQEIPFTVTQELLHNLVNESVDRVQEDVRGNQSVAALDLAVMVRATTTITANGYTVTDPIGSTATELSISEVAAVSQSYTVEQIASMHERVAPKTELTRFSFMLMLHCVVRDIYTKTQNYCLIDVTHNATELAVVQDDVLEYCTYTELGLQAIVEKLANAFSMSISEARAKLTDPRHQNWHSTLSEGKRQRYDEICASYQSAIKTLIADAHGSFAIPNTFFIHCDHTSESWLQTQTRLALADAKHTNATLYGITNELLERHATDDDSSDKEKESEQAKLPGHTSTLVAAQFFHKKHHCRDFKQL